VWILSVTRERSNVNGREKNIRITTVHTRSYHSCIYIVSQKGKRERTKEWRERGEKKAEEGFHRQ